MKDLLILLFFIWGAECIGQVPGTLSYQGILTDASGNPVGDGEKSITFNFYNVATGGAVIQVRGPFPIITSKGLFTAIIGNGQGFNNTALPFNLGDQQIYVGIVANGGNELSPRVQLTAVPYAFRAAMATALDATATVAGSQVGTGINAAHITSGTLPAGQIASGSIDNTKLVAGIDASKITTGVLPMNVMPATTGVPIGTIEAWAGSDTTKLPAGWLVCDGRTLSRAAYSALYNIVGVSWGGGNGNSTFNKPDLRGRFLRGFDSGAGVDPDANARTALYPGTGVATGDKIGSYQLDQYISHRHNSNAAPGSGWRRDGAIGNTSTADGLVNNTITALTSFEGGSETRPKNAYMNFIIKAQ